MILKKLLMMLVVSLPLLNFAVYFSVDTRDGFAVHFPLDRITLYVGYRYSGFSAKVPVYENVAVKTQLGVDPFSQSGFLDAKVGGEFFQTSLYGGAMVSVLSDSQNNQRFVKRGNVDLSLDLQGDVFEVLSLGLSVQRTLLGFYQDTESGGWTFVVPPFKLDSLGVLLEPFIVLNFEAPIKSQIRISYAFNIAWVESLPSALIDLRGFRITFLAWVF